MSILFVLLTFLVIMTVTYFTRRGIQPTVTAHRSKELEVAASPVLIKEGGFEIPKGYCFHPGHTWVYDEGRQNARVGIDSFAANLFGKLDGVEIAGMNRWVRQGQKICTLTSGEVTADLLSPIEGVVVSINHEVQKDPQLITNDPYKDGWLCVIKSPEMNVNLKNLLQGSLISSWLQNSTRRLQSFAAPLGAATADGGLPVAGILARVKPETRQKMIHEFLLS
ncbi:MAG TPA: glycine cleavage system protein H [Terriglobales bacterium]|nr:glycine cleavage system protein H [Terriglobales bacterium]